MRYADTHKAETRQRVLKVAAREIRAKGPDNVAVAGVMASAGLTHGGFYAHFGSKQALISEAIGTMFDDARQRIGTIDSDDPKTALRRYVDFYLSKGHRDGRDRGCPLPALAGDLVRSGAAAREQFGAGVAGLTNRLANSLNRVGVDNANAEASSMLAQMVGAVVLSRAVDDAAQADAILADTHAAIVERYGLGRVQ